VRIRLGEKLGVDASAVRHHNSNKIRAAYFVGGHQVSWTMLLSAATGTVQLHTARTLPAKHKSLGEIQSREK
jgi:hypothetical protein